MGNAESVVLQKRLARFRPEDRPAVEGAFDRLQTGAGGPCAAPGKVLPLEVLQVRLCSSAFDHFCSSYLTDHSDSVHETCVVVVVVFLNLFNHSSELNLIEDCAD